MIEGYFEHTSSSFSVFPSRLGKSHLSYHLSLYSLISVIVFHRSPNCTPESESVRHPEHSGDCALGPGVTGNYHGRTKRIQGLSNCEFIVWWNIWLQTETEDILCFFRSTEHNVTFTKNHLISICLHDSNEPVLAAKSQPWLRCFSSLRSTTGGTAASWGGWGSTGDWSLKCFPTTIQSPLGLSLISSPIATTRCT